MEKLNVFLKHNQTEYKVLKNTSLLQFSRQFKDDFKYQILLANVDNELKELNSTKIDRNCTIEFLDITNKYGFGAYQRSVSFLMIFAVKEVLGIKTQVVIEHTINKNYYCEIPKIKITDEVLKKIEYRMNKAVEADIPIEKLVMPLEEGMEIFKKFGMDKMADALKYIKTSNINLYKLGWFYDYLYGSMVPSTRYLKSFKLVKYDNGFLIQLPSMENPEKLAEVKILTKISQVFSESSQWAKILKVDTVGALNDTICNGDINDIIWISEALHEKKIANIADMITNQKKNIVLIAGPSSSGKTTFAKRLCIQLKVNGIKPYIISIDDYYLSREFTPLGEDGKPDYESLKSIDIKQFSEDMNNLLNGEKVQIPKYNFLTGKREYKGNLIKLESDEILIIEGIHGLNEELTKNIPKENKFKVYISALTQLNIDDHNRISTTDTRIIRRMVRDNNFRGFDAISTIDIWPSVSRGENLNIYPFQEEADAMFNSALIYELSILKQHAEPLLFKIDKSQPQYVEAKRLIKFLNCFLGANSSVIPKNSIIREFIGGSCFDA